MLDVPTCSCGTFAVGRCVQCGEAICRDHRIVVEEKLYCREHGVIANQTEIARRNTEVATWRETAVARLDEILDVFIEAMGTKGLRDIRVSKKRGDYGKVKWKTIGRGWPFYVRVPKDAKESLYLTPKKELVDRDTGFPGRTDRSGFPSPFVLTGSERSDRMLDKLGASATIEQLSRHLRDSSVPWPPIGPPLSLGQEPPSSIYLPRF